MPKTDEEITASENDIINDSNDNIEGLQNTQKTPEKENANINDSVNDDAVPENYDFKDVQIPEGIELDKELTDEFSKAAKEMNLSQKKADKFMSMGVKLTQKLTDKFQSLLNEAHENQVKSYATLLNTDPEIGGPKLKKSLADANVAYSAFVSDEAAKLLADTGLNKHPAIVKVFMEIGKQIKEDTIRQSGEPNKERTAADWYPEMSKN